MKEIENQRLCKSPCQDSLLVVPFTFTYRKTDLSGLGIGRATLPYIRFTFLVLNICKHAVTIPGMVMTYVLNKSLKKNKKLELHSLGGIYHLCRDKREEFQHCSCSCAWKCGCYCEECQLHLMNLENFACEKAVVYELLKTDMVGGTAQAFTKYHEKVITPIKSHVYGEKSKLTKGVIGYDANVLHCYCSDDVMPCGKYTMVVNKKAFDQKRIAKFSKNDLKEK